VELMVTRRTALLSFASLLAAPLGRRGAADAREGRDAAYRLTVSRDAGVCGVHENTLAIWAGSKAKTSNAKRPSPKAVGI
jgi:hypothetical protein